MRREKMPKAKPRKWLKIGEAKRRAQACNLARFMGRGGKRTKVRKVTTWETYIEVAP